MARVIGILSVLVAVICGPAAEAGLITTLTFDSGEIVATSPDGGGVLQYREQGVLVTEVGGDCLLHDVLTCHFLVVPPSSDEFDDDPALLLVSSVSAGVTVTMENGVAFDLLGLSHSTSPALITSSAGAAIGTPLPPNPPIVQHLLFPSAGWTGITSFTIHTSAPEGFSRNFFDDITIHVPQPATLVLVLASIVIGGAVRRRFRRGE